MISIFLEHWTTQYSNKQTLSKSKIKSTKITDLKSKALSIITKTFYKDFKKKNKTWLNVSKYKMKIQTLIHINLNLWNGNLIQEAIQKMSLPWNFKKFKLNKLFLKMCITPGKLKALWIKCKDVNGTVITQTQLYNRKRCLLTLKQINQKLSIN